MSEQGTPVAAPESPEVVGARARAQIAAWQDAQPAAVHARAVADVGPMVSPRDPTPRPPICGVTSAPVPRDPPGMPHRVPLAGAEVIGEAHVLAALTLCRAACEGMALRTVTRERMPPRAPVAPPELPELVPGADAAGRRADLVRIAALIPAVREWERLLAGQPDGLAARARRAVARATPA
jgi:hypothetical protein